MKLTSKFTTDLEILTDKEFHALCDLTSEFTTTAYLNKTITLNIGTKIGDKHGIPSSIANRVVSVVQNFREDIRPCGGRLLMDEIEYHYHTNGDNPTIVKGVPIYETTIQISFVGNLSLPTIKALVIALCYATNQEAIPVLVQARYRSGGLKMHNSTVSFGMMVGQTLSEAQKWGKFDPQYFIK